MGRVYFANSNVARSTTATTTFVDKTRLTFTPNASKNYVCFWNCTLDNNSLTTDGIARANILTPNRVQQTFNIEVQDSADVVSMPGMFFYTSPASPTAQTWAIQFATEGASTVGIADAYMVALELDASDIFTANGATTTRLNAAYANLGNTIITCTAGDWMLIASAEYNYSGSPNNPNGGLRLHNVTSGTQIANNGTPITQDTTSWTPAWIIAKQTFSSSATVALQLRSDGNSTIGARNVRLLALDLSKFKSHFISQNLNNRSVSTVAQVTTDEFTTDFLADDDYLMLFSIGSTSDSTTVFTGLEFNVNYEEGDISLNSELITRENNSTNETFDTGAAIVFRPDRKRAIWKIKANVQTSGATATVRNRVIAGLQLGDNPPRARRIVLG